MKFQLVSPKRDKIALLIFLSFYIFFGVLGTIFQERIIYHPNKQDFQTCADFSSAEKINYKGTRAYFKNNGPRLIVFYHGNAGSACDRAFIAQIFEQQGYSYLIPEYAGYSNGIEKPSHELLKKDIAHTVEFIREHNYSETVVAGESIGTGLAAYHVSLQNPDKLLLISPFSSLVDVAKNKFWFYPVSLMVKNDFINTVLLGGFKGKILVIHGGQDKVIPLKLGQKLFDSLNNSSKEMVIVQKAGHNNIFEFPETYNAIFRFLKEKK